jgi:hypothetical protein
MENFVTVRECQNNRTECQKQCESFQKGLCDKVEKINLENTLNTNFRLGAEKAIWILFGAVVTGISGIIFTLFKIIAILGD